MMVQDWRALADELRAVSGVVLGDAQLGSLRAALRRVDPGMDAGDLLRQPDPDRRAHLLDRLVDEITVNETFFLRHLDELAALDWNAMAGRAAAAGRPEVRVWSAACSTGEEAYTLALLAAETFAGAAVPVDILATDISVLALRAAETGVYGTRSARPLSAEQRERWFADDPEGLTVGPELRALVRFARHNLTQDPAPPAGEAPFDAIVCRNVLIYFAPAVARDVLAGLRHALTDDGRLVVGAADRLAAGPAQGLPSAPVTAHRRDAPLAEPPAPPPPFRERRRPAARAPRRPPAQERRAPPAPSAGPQADFVAGVGALEQGDAPAAVRHLRRTLYADPGHAAAALQLGRAHEAAGDPVAARSAYTHAIRAAEGVGADGATVGDRVAALDVATAAQARLRALGST